MKKLLILSLIIFCFYGCKSTSSEESAIPGVGGNWANKSTLTKTIFTDLIRSQGPIGIVWDNICNKNAKPLTFKKMIIVYDESVHGPGDSSTFIKYDIRLSNNDDKIQYEQVYRNFFLKERFADEKTSTIESAEFDKEKSYIKYNSTPEAKEYSTKGFSTLGLEDSTEETFEQFCEKYETAYEEAKSNYKVVTNAVPSEISKQDSYYNTMSYPAVYSKLENKESKDSIETWTAPSGKLKGLALKIIEKDSKQEKWKEVKDFDVE